MALLGSELSTDKALATEMNIRFIGCASHRLNLAFADIICRESYVVDKVQVIKKNLCNLFPGARLRKFTPRGPVLNNVIRGSSTFAVLKRYIALFSYSP